MLSKIYENIEKRNFNCCQNYAVDVIGRQTRCIRANIQARKRCAQNAIRRFTGFQTITQKMIRHHLIT